MDKTANYGNFLSKNTIYIPINSLRKCMSVQEMKDCILILEHAGWVYTYKIHPISFFENYG